MTSRGLVGQVIALGVLGGVGQARAGAPELLGHGGRSAGLAGAAIADAEPSEAARGNAAAAAAAGVRVRLGYGYAGLDLRLDGRDAGVEDASGVDFAAQGGGRIGPVTLGGALAVHMPDTHLARIGFRPATEPQFVRYEASLQRVTADAVLAVRYGPVSLGGGAALGLDTAGRGVDVALGQDGHGTYADAAADVELPYRAAPIAGLAVDLGWLGLGASFRGATAVDLRLESEATIALADSPLNGTTTVGVQGASGWDPAALALGARAEVGWGLSAMAALEYDLWSAAPPPVADVTVDVRLGTVPSQREARFVAPRFRDTLSPRVGIELRRPAGGEEVVEGQWAARLGYALSPSPVPPQTGFTSYADAARHTIAAGGGYHYGRLAGVDLSADLGLGLHLLSPRVEEKASDSLPFARYEVRGRIYSGALSIEGAWR
ncbi:MAG: hypothetical protein IT372_19130 [Polyangiaceae bacterium]|nr:hypothetical protein [Polyangiaceae bacterium]